MVDALGDPRGPARRPPQGAPLRENLDNSSRGLGSVERRRRGTLDDLDPFDVFRVDVVERTCLDVAAPP